MDAGIIIIIVNIIARRPWEQQPGQTKQSRPLVLCAVSVLVLVLVRVLLCFKSFYTYLPTIR